MHNVNATCYILGNWFSVVLQVHFFCKLPCLGAIKYEIKLNNEHTVTLSSSLIQ